MPPTLLPFGVRGFSQEMSQNCHRVFCGEGENAGAIPRHGLPQGFSQDMAHQDVMPSAAKADYLPNAAPIEACAVNVHAERPTRIIGGVGVHRTGIAKSTLASCFLWVLEKDRDRLFVLNPLHNAVFHRPPRTRQFALKPPAQCGHHL